VKGVFFTCFSFEILTSQPWLTSSVDHGIFVRRKFPSKKFGQSENGGDPFFLWGGYQARTRQGLAGRRVRHNSWGSSGMQSTPILWRISSISQQLVSYSPVFELCSLLAFFPHRRLLLRFSSPLASRRRNWSRLHPWITLAAAAKSAPFGLGDTADLHHAVWIAQFEPLER